METTNLRPVSEHTIRRHMTVVTTFGETGATTQEALSILLTLHLSASALIERLYHHPGKNYLLACVARSFLGSKYPEMREEFIRAVLSTPNWAWDDDTAGHAPYHRRFLVSTATGFFAGRPEPAKFIVKGDPPPSIRDFPNHPLWNAIDADSYWLQIVPRRLARTGAEKLWERFCQAFYGIRVPRTGRRTSSEPEHHLRASRGVIVELIELLYGALLENGEVRSVKLVKISPEGPGLDMARALGRAIREGSSGPRGWDPEVIDDLGQKLMEVARAAQVAQAKRHNR